MAPTADYLLLNGQTPSGQPIDIAIADSKIAAQGHNLSSSYPQEKTTKTFDLTGKTISPGLWDSHMHLYHWCQLRQSIDLAACQHAQEVLEKLEKAPKTSGWLQGFDLRQTSSLTGKSLNRQQLDSVEKERPVLLWSHDLHSVLANTPALIEIGLLDFSGEIEGGLIERDASGKPTGWLSELAANHARQAIPAPGSKELEALLLTAQSHLHRLGITGLCDQRIKDQDEVFPLLKALTYLQQKKQLKLRATINVASHHLDDPTSLSAYPFLGGDLLRPGHVKVFADGTMGSGTARMLEPFSHGGKGRDGRGIYLTPPLEIAAAFKKASSAGHPISVHAIGDEANRVCLNAFSDLQSSGYPNLHLPHRIEHAQLLQDIEIDRFAKLGVIASIQAGHLLDDRDSVDNLLGKRARLAYRFLDLHKAGATLIFGTDAPISNIDPRYGIEAAIYRKLSIEADPAWYPNQCLPSEVVWAGYTEKASSALGWQDLTGSLQVGKKADIVVWSANPTEKNKKPAKVLKTFFNGELVYENNTCYTV